MSCRGNLDSTGAGALYSTKNNIPEVAAAAQNVSLMLGAGAAAKDVLEGFSTCAKLSVFARTGRTWSLSAVTHDFAGRGRFSTG